MTAHAGRADRHEDLDHMGFGEQDPHEARSNVLLGVKLGILSEAMLFGALFAAYFVIRSESGEWPPRGGERPELILPGLNTLLLVSSSVTMQWAVRAIGRGELAAMRLGLRLTILLGTIFIVIQAYEFANSGFGLTSGVFGSTFYTLTGFHGAHVLAGLGLLSIVAIRGRRGLISAERSTAVEAVSYYWHFVDVVWLFLFSTLYVL
jgi:cytochrome c oxidase subunit III